jgi:hypothetical protein
MEPLLEPDPASAPPVAPLPTGGLSDRDVRILELERRDWRSPGAKELAVRTELGLSSARYYQVLNALLDSPAALRADPMLVKRLRRIREARIDARRARRFRSSAAGSDHE